MLQVTRFLSVSAPETLQDTVDDTEVLFPWELLSFFDHTNNQTPATPVDAVGSRAEEEFAWYLSNTFGDLPSVFASLQEQFISGKYKFLPIVAKNVFAVPMLSARLNAISVCANGWSRRRD